MVEVYVSLGAPLAYLDLGGGFASRATLHEQYAPGADASPALDDYAEAIAGVLLNAGSDDTEAKAAARQSLFALVGSDPAIARIWNDWERVNTCPCIMYFCR